MIELVVAEVPASQGFQLAAKCVAVRGEKFRIAHRYFWQRRRSIVMIDHIFLPGRPPESKTGVDLGDTSRFRHITALPPSPPEIGEVVIARRRQVCKRMFVVPAPICNHDRLSKCRVFNSRGSIVSDRSV